MIPLRPNSAQVTRTAQCSSRLSREDGLRNSIPGLRDNSSHSRAPSRSHISEIGSIFARDLKPPEQQSRGYPPTSPSCASDLSTRRRCATDCFDGVIEDFVEIVRVEGRRAFELARCKMKSDMVLGFEAEKNAISDEVRVRDSQLFDARRDLDISKARIKKMSFQLSNFARAYAVRQASSPLQDGPNLVSDVWRLLRKKVHDRISTRESSERVYSIFYQYKFLTRLFHQWHLDSIRNNFAQAQVAAVRAVQAEHSLRHNDLSSQNSKLQSELERIQIQLSQEISRRECMQSKMKDFLLSKIENFGVEDSSPERPRSAHPLPQVLNYIAPPVERRVHMLKQRN